MSVFKTLCAVSDFLINPSLQAKNILSIKKELILPVKLLIVDFDGVLAPQGGKVPLQETMTWLLTTKKKIVILSNNPTKERQEYFAINYPEIDFFVAQHKKPHPLSIELLLKKHQCSSQEALLIDDRLSTGILAAIFTNTKAVYITNPYVDFSANRFQECKTYVFRCVEQLLAKIILIFRDKPLC